VQSKTQRKDLQTIRRILSEHKAELRQRFHIRRIALFGSWARQEASEQSDIDILVEFEQPIGWEIVDVHRYLEELLGLRVDLVTPRALKRKPLLWASVQEDLIDV